jgi:hypothetical protein
MECSFAFAKTPILSLKLIEMRLMASLCRFISSAKILLKNKGPSPFELSPPHLRIVEIILERLIISLQ